MTVTEALSSVDYGGDIVGVNFRVVEYKYVCIWLYNIYVYKGVNETGSRLDPIYIYHNIDYS